MGIRENVIACLTENKWCFETVAPSFRNTLSKQTINVDARKSITELCLAHYSKIRPTEIEIVRIEESGTALQLNIQTAGTIQKIMSIDHPKSELGIFSSDESIKLKNASDFVKHFDMELAHILSKNEIVFLRLLNTNFRSASHPHIFGAIIIGDKISSQNDNQLATSLVHELAHQELFLVNLIDRLVNKVFDNNEIHAPLQGRNRPPIGRLHSLWALHRMIQFLKISGQDFRELKPILKENLNAFEKKELTEFGAMLVEIAKKNA